MENTVHGAIIMLFQLLLEKNISFMDEEWNKHSLDSVRHLA